MQAEVIATLRYDLLDGENAIRTRIVYGHRVSCMDADEQVRCADWQEAEQQCDEWEHEAGLEGLHILPRIDLVGPPEPDNGGHGSTPPDTPSIQDTMPLEYLTERES
tara:strand:+ start:197 stop:517 length:321 start_codon:yes stop_codon:yes gene_type:complete